jgi:phosphatidylserine/phosphatidylglycerophosphate/cardiolipin synthase-like enzyme
LTKKSNNRSDSTGRSLLATLLLGIVIVIAAVLSRVTGIDFLSILNQGGTPAPTSAVVTQQRPPATAAPGSPTSAPPATGGVLTINIPQGFGAQKGFWRVFFTAPTGSADAKTYVGGIDTQLAADIQKTTKTLDIAAYQWNNPVITQAVVDAVKRGVKVRMVVDTQFTLQDEDSTIGQLQKLNVPIVDDKRTAFMHDKFMILDSATVWMGSWNYTVNDTYRNNNNALAIRSQKFVQNYQAEFDEMFVNQQFGPRSPKNTPNPSFSQDGIPIQVYFAPEDLNTEPIKAALNNAKKDIRFMAFQFTLDDVAQTMLAKSKQGVKVQGIFEATGSKTAASEMPMMLCAGLPVRQDGNKFILHHKVMIIDDNTVITGSFNFSANAAASNDDNLIIIQDKDLAAQYIAEYNRRWAEARQPEGITCN